MVPDGRLQRGSCSPDELPEGVIELSSYLIDEAPVSNSMFAEFIRDGGYRTPTLWTPAGWTFVQDRELESPN